jgi:RNA repair, ligase-Pnkp-associating, region of Hen1
MGESGSDGRPPEPLSTEPKGEGDGGEGGIRTPQDPLESATCRFYIARIAAHAIDAVAHCPRLPAGLRFLRLAGQLQVIGGPKRRPHLDVGDEVERHFQPFARLSQLSAFVPPHRRFLVEHPARVRRREFPFGNATVFDAEVTVDACTAAVMLDVDPIGMVLCGQPLPWRRSVPARVRASRLSDRHCKSVEHYPDFGSTALAFAKQAERNTAPRPLRKRPVMSLHSAEAVHVDECYRHEIRDGSSKVALANRNDPIEALLFNRSHEAFRVRFDGVERGCRAPRPRHRRPATASHAPGRSSDRVHRGARCSNRSLASASVGGRTPCRTAPSRGGWPRVRPRSRGPASTRRRHEGSRQSGSRVTQRLITSGGKR